jgi:hypothetical protein
MVYKLATEKFNRLGALAFFEKGDQRKISPKETMNFLLESLLPDDSQQNETPVQEVWRWKCGDRTLIHAPPNTPPEWLR